MPQKFYDHILNLVGILARYVVMENIYVQSQLFGMQEEYQSSLMCFCKAYLQYLSAVMSQIRGTTIFSNTRMDDMYEQVLLTDKKCRDFTTSLYDIGDDEDGHSGDGLDSFLQRLSEEEDMSDATEEDYIMVT